MAHHGRDLVAVVALVGLGLGVALVPASLRNCVRLPGVAYLFSPGMWWYA
jgi:hypothetical protein